MDIFADLLREARGRYEFRVVDVGPDYNMPIHWTALENADTVFVVATPERTALLDVKNLIPDLEETFGTLTRFRLVLNGFSEDFGIKPKEVVDYLGGKIPLAGQLSWQPNAARRAINLGEPLVLQRPLSPLGRDLMDLAMILYPPLEALTRKRGTKKQGMFGKLTGVFARHRRKTHA
jgi:Flp pilus assembly CpaE family ATPase